MPKVDKRHNDYSSHSLDYDSKRFDGRQNQYLEMLRWRAVERSLRRVDRSASVLDVGCGTGRGIKYMVNSGFRKIHGLDYTAAMLEVAQAYVDTLDSSYTVHLQQGDAFSLPFGDDEFDVIVSLNFLHMFTFDLQRELIAEMDRVCRPGGMMILEFESIHKGMFLTRYIEQRRVAHRTKFNSIWEIRRLLPASEYTLVRAYGTALPVIYRVLSHWPRIGEVIERAALFPPFNWLSERVVVSVTK
jgi:ubiquinone/menaquinone biosynthesis C-methylase UbiE